MERVITGFHEDDVGDWVAELECGHNQHVRHRPPFQMRQWVVDDTERRARIGSELECSLCDRAELPTWLRRVRNSPVWDAQTMPPGLRRRHRLAHATWGVLHVETGVVVFDEDEMPAGATRAIPPDVEHQVEPRESASFWIEFFTVDRTTGTAPPGGSGNDDAGGDPACWANLLCPECGAVMDGGPHKTGCPRA